MHARFMNRKFAYITHNTHRLLRSNKYICFSWSVLLPSGKLLLPIPKFSKMAKDLMFFTPLLPFSRGFRNYKINYCPTESSKGVCFCGKALTVVGVWFAVIFLSTFNMNYIRRLIYLLLFCWFIDILVRTT